MGCQADGSLQTLSQSADLAQILRRIHGGNAHRFQSSMEKDGDASIAVVRRHKPGLFGLLRRNSERRKSEGARFRPIVFRRIFEGPIATTKEDREVTRLKIDDGDVGATVAIEVSGKPEIRSCIGTGVMPWLERSIAVTKEGRKAIPLAVDHQQVADLVVIEVGETDPKRTFARPIIGGGAKRTVPVPGPNGNRV